MHHSPPPELDSRIEEWGDRLIIRHKPQLGAYLVLAVFALFWLGFDVFTFVKLVEDPLEPFLWLWLIAWTAGGPSAVWSVLATSTVTVTPEFVELRREF